MADLYPSRRFGKFEIDRFFIMEHPSIIKRIMGECVILKADWLPHKDAIEYTAISDWFDEVPLGNEPAYYSIILTKEGNNYKWGFGSGVR